MASTPTQLRDEIRRNLAFALTAADETNADLCVLRSAARWKCHKGPSDATAAAAYRFVLDGALDLQTAISECKVICNTAIAFNAANFATFQLVQNDGIGGADVVIGTLDTSAVSFVAKIARSMTLTAATQLVPAGKQLEVVMTKSGTGVVTDSLSFIIKGLPV